MANWSNHLNTMQTDAGERRKYNMAAKDYKICPALFNAYIAKTSKKNPNMMTSDRRKITENEILVLIDWYLDKELPEDEQKKLSFESLTREGMRIEMKFVKQEEIGDK